MKFIVGLAFVFSYFQGMANLSIEGFYQGKNLYVQSSLCNDGFGYCATKVTVNGNTMPFPSGRGAFEINFSNFNIQMGEPLFIVIEHNDECMPKIINPEVLLPNSTFIVDQINCSNDGTLSWVTSKESGVLTYQIEQYKWNKWIVIGEVKGSGKKASNQYLFKVVPHSGENKVRISQTDNTMKKRTSKEVLFTTHSIKRPVIESINNYSAIKFVVNGQKVETKYEIFDTFGNILKKGMASEVDFTNLKEGIYYVNYDNQNEKIIKK